MNELIKALAEEAGIVRTMPANVIPGIMKNRFTHLDLEKFAELIVRECINKIETYQISVGNSAAGEMACDWTYDALKEIRTDIKETFGLK